ncbi:MAG: DNA polymerase IV [Oscillospiraceae bacterium]|nr:DNA polymerase IV [Oscillospiraceae bacterium]
MERLILHVDVNNAFLSWTAVDKLSKGGTFDIRTVPSIIGGDEAQRHGIVLAKSTPAKKLGIKTADPIYFAKQKCKDLLIFPANFEVYKKYSNALYEILTNYTDRIERFSIDECFMDMTGCTMNYNSIMDIAKEVSARVFAELGFTVNIGIAHNKLLAKMASDLEKPNKIHTLYENEIETKIWGLPVNELFMVGKKSVDKLRAMHINTIGDLAKSDKNLIVKKFGKFGLQVHNYANGIDNSEVIYTKQKPKGVSNETTLAEDISDYDRICEHLLPLAEQTMYRLRKENMSATVISVKIKTKDFQIFSKQRKLQVATDSTKEVFDTAKELLQEVLKNKDIRLIGIRVDGLVDNSEVQFSFFDIKNRDKQKRLDNAVDKIKDKFGYGMITRAGELKRKK